MANTSYIVESLTSNNFSSNVEIASRKFDGKWNLWVKELFMSNAPEDLSWNWTVVNVFDTESDARKGLEEFRKLIIASKNK